MRASRRRRVGGCQRQGSITAVIYIDCHPLYTSEGTVPASRCPAATISSHPGSAAVNISTLRASALVRGESRLCVTIPGHAPRPRPRHLASVLPAPEITRGARPGGTGRRKPGHPDRECRACSGITPTLPPQPLPAGGAQNVADVPQPWPAPSLRRRTMHATIATVAARPADTAVRRRCERRCQRFTPKTPPSVPTAPPSSSRSRAPPRLQLPGNNSGDSANESVM